MRPTPFPAQSSVGAVLSYASICAQPRWRRADLRDLAALNLPRNNTGVAMEMKFAYKSDPGDEAELRDVSVQIACFFCNASVWGHRKDGRWITPSNCPSCDEDASQIVWENVLLEW